VIERLEPDAYVLAVHFRLSASSLPDISRSKNGVASLAHAPAIPIPLRRVL
jgi:hypothetical protein